MKKFIIILSAILVSALLVSAAPAYPYPITVTQPDGSKITIQLHGDEYYHWITSNGVVVEKGADGFYRKVSSVLTKSSPATDRAAIARALEKRARNAQYMQKAPYSGIGHGNSHFLVILVEFADLKFSISNPNQAFSDMLNKAGYSLNGAIGSAADYFSDNSSGDFTPVFDVVGPIAVSGKVASYGDNVSEDDGDDKDPGKAFYEACQKAYNQGLVDFSKYDLDNNGLVDNVFFYFAGHNEAEYGGKDKIWPHASSLYSYDATFNGKKVWSYACTSELKGSSGVNMTGIGTFCHEFSHVLGLPDFYDVDYEENGESQNLPESLSLMSSGNYNNNGHVPPFMTAMERKMLGWMGDFTTLEPGTRTLQPLTSNVGYVTPTSNSGEFFLFEVRTGERWDSYVGNQSGNAANVGKFKGLVVYHVDQSANKVGNVAAANRWKSGSALNAYAEHPCFYVKKARNTTSFAWPFPGTANVTSFTDMSSMAFRSWDGQSTGYALDNIAYSDGKVSLNVTLDKTRKIQGVVSDTSGKPIAGATVYVTTNAAASKAAATLQSGKNKLLSPRMVMKTAGAHEIKTASDGSYQVALEDGDGTEVSMLVSATGYRNHTDTFILTTGGVRKDVVLYGIAESTTANLQKYQNYSGYSIGSGTTPCSITLAVRFSAEELKPYVGRMFSTISFAVLEGDKGAEQIDAFVDVKGKRVLTQKVGSHAHNQIISVDVSSHAFVIPDNTDIYFGYSVKNCDYGYPAAIADEDGVDGGGFYSGRFEYTTAGVSNWYQLASTEGSYNAVISATVKEKISPLVSLGIKTIANPRNGESYAAGETFNFSLTDAGDTPTQTEWYFDDARMNGTSVVLTAGDHTVKALLTYADGTAEEIVQVIKVQ